MKFPFKAFYWNEKKINICALSGGKCVKNVNFFKIIFTYLRN